MGGVRGKEGHQRRLRPGVGREGLPLHELGLRAQVRLWHALHVVDPRRDQHAPRGDEGGDGTVDRLWQRHVKAMADVNCDAIKSAETLVAHDGDEENQQLDLGDMGGSFIFHFSRMGVAIVMAVVYQCRRKRAERMRMAAERKKEKSAAQDGSALSHEQLEQQEVEEGMRSRALYEEQNERLAEMSEQMKKLLEAMEEIRGESSSLRQRRGPSRRSQHLAGQ
mmetsp:Transcript_38092/g.70261  ORF Transcript_38092/g.70261 Transcript_38092/m.70261 type:complete len:222 (-) Transcript_38092:287-952(-)